MDDEENGTAVKSRKTGAAAGGGAVRKVKQASFLDARDYRLLYELDVDCRQPLTKLAAKLGISKQRVAYRMARLEENAIILGYRTMIDSSRLGFLQIRVYVRLRRANEAVTRKILDFLKAQKKVWALVRITGPSDFVFVVGIKRPVEFHALWRQVEDKFKQYIAGAKISIYSPVYHFAKAYLIGITDETRPRVIGGEPVEVDELDLKILDLISANARLSAVEIASKTGVDPQTVSSRIRKLQDTGVIQGYRASIDVDKLGFEFYKVDFALASTVDREKIREYCHLNSNIYQVNETIGGADLEVELHVRSLKELLEKIEGLKNAFPNTIESFEQYRLWGEEKMVYFPE
ncbi:MAG: Lrp/AsnC family transcriptional regulator [Candidatus Micrarchaeota archaeon]